MGKKYLINAFLLAWLAVLAIDALPQLNDFHGKLKNGLDAYLDATGLWQGRWTLFAPDPDQLNVAVSATITYADGETRQWRSPKWRELTAFERFLKFREAEFIDNIRMDIHQGGWMSFADYLVRNHPHPTHPEVKAAKIVLTRHWVNIPPPSRQNVSVFPDPPALNNSFAFYKKEYPQ